MSTASLHAGAPPSALTRTAGLVAVAVTVAFAATSAVAQPPMSAADFLSAAAQSDLYEIDAAELILAQSQDPQVRAFAQEMVVDHTQTSKALAQAAHASGLAAPPMALSGDQRAMLGALQSVKSPDLERTYITQQVNAHLSALVMEQGYASSGVDPNLRNAARAAVPTIQHHLEMAQQMKGAMAASDSVK